MHMNRERNAQTFFKKILLSTYVFVKHHKMDREQNDE